MKKKIIITVCRNNHVAGGTVYMLPELAGNVLQFILADATIFQARAFDADKRLHLSTVDKSPRKDQLLQVDSMPIPVVFERGHFTVDGNLLADPTTWKDLRGMKGNAAFDAVAKVQSLTELLHARKAAKRN